MVNQDFSDIEAEYCLSEGDGPRRIDGSVKYATAPGLKDCRTCSVRSDSVRHQQKRVGLRPFEDLKATGEIVRWSSKMPRFFGPDWIERV